jgi:hypothetical protein
MTDLPDDEPQPGSRAWMEQTAQLDSAMATARRYLSALNAQDHPACNAILVELACDRDGSMVKAFMALAAQAPGREQPASKPTIVRDPAPAAPQPQEPASKGRPRAKPKVAEWEDGGPGALGGDWLVDAYSLLDYFDQLETIGRHPDPGGRTYRTDMHSPLPNTLPLLARVSERFRRNYPTGWPDPQECCTAAEGKEYDAEAARELANKLRPIIARLTELLDLLERRGVLGTLAGDIR